MVVTVDEGSEVGVVGPALSLPALPHAARSTTAPTARAENRRVRLFTKRLTLASPTRVPDVSRISKPWSRRHSRLKTRMQIYPSVPSWASLLVSNGVMQIEYLFVSRGFAEGFSGGGCPPVLVLVE